MTNMTNQISNNTGSVQSQVRFLTDRIQKLSRHLGTHKKDFSCQRSIRKLLIKRKRLLLYLYKKDKTGYNQVKS
uniref:Small ribosomal subunit protein uS15c n=2 Tax=Welwitschia mirabilis TaxID=3377 RepID=RR15_WELMI|nr:ribosomal protein S15 [Welwitschia mirabilis]B2Y208.1 RecName: Full=Small ribosomal subunit protein uS15c; AltName: Full=30S ribosomal protein S15, chloroplastic [Welwitschia mirabilis]ABY26838.1 ribosomal protein S15 [Welwitschia mirabilis]AMA21036.1 ribosomal protein S15 [Welwitschia mirabilis]BAH11180.1 ribosomal protein S15 [Welwitschia mirabilis]